MALRSAASQLGVGSSAGSPAAPQPALPQQRGGAKRALKHAASRTPLRVAAVARPAAGGKAPQKRSVAARLGGPAEMSVDLTEVRNAAASSHSVQQARARAARARARAGPACSDSSCVGLVWRAFGASQRPGRAAVSQRRAGDR